MARLFVCDRNGSITADIDASGTVLGDALEHEKADPVIRCAVLMALSALARGGTWPIAVLQVMSTVMADMKAEVLAERLM
jgi:hypothetical protein